MFTVLSLKFICFFVVVLSGVEYDGLKKEKSYGKGLKSIVALILAVSIFVTALPQQISAVAAEEPAKEEQLFENAENTSKEGNINRKNTKEASNEESLDEENTGDASNEKGVGEKNAEHISEDISSGLGAALPDTEAKGKKKSYS